MSRILMFGATRHQIQATADAFNEMFPGSAFAPHQGGLNAALKEWHAGAFKILVLNYQQCTGFRAPDGTKVILLDGCPDEAHRIQAMMRVRRFESVANE